jgi:glucose-6-phosphate isomerase
MTTPSAIPKTHSLRKRPAWRALEKHYQKICNVHLRSLFADDPRRGERLVAEDAGIYLDYSKNRITDETIQLLVKLVEECGLREGIDAMFRGKKISGGELVECDRRKGRKM